MKISMLALLVAGIGLSFLPAGNASPGLAEGMETQFSSVALTGYWIHDAQDYARQNVLKERWRYIFKKNGEWSLWRLSPFARCWERELQGPYWIEKDRLFLREKTLNIPWLQCFVIRRLDSQELHLQFEDGTIMEFRRWD